ncbi:hypothetical protein BDY19DRAFT_136988 [Irpex rosettiformis]|uniref:Uncharacterized protein n=1 Tax=Irpex rosettiformis TaxID=378272 RepID=A0ACB8U5R2_9APHY|nr:hypothetical protein BDY19DRAFT_136988 [Irpex rosettiformis]
MLYSTYAKVEGTVGSREGAMVWWLKAAGNSTGNIFSPQHTQVPRGIEARAWSCLSHGYEDTSIDDDGITCNIDAMYRAAACADKACGLGLVTPSILMLGRKIERYREEIPTSGDPRFRFDAPRFTELTYLWEAHHQRQEEYLAEIEKRETKVARRPDAYRCAAPGCGIEATRKSGLKVCGGKCPVGRKPSYCSKECQKKDWKRHKPVCLGLSKAPVPDEDSEVESDVDNTQSTRPDAEGSDFNPEDFNKSGNE